MKGWEEEAESISSHQQLNFSLLENLNAVIQLEKKDPHTKSQTVRQISLLNKLPLSFTPSKYTPRRNGMFLNVRIKLLKLNFLCYRLCFCLVLLTDDPG